MTNQETAASIQSMGGHARAAALTPEERSAAASKAATARWNVSAFKKQVGGNHYKDYAIQPVEFCQKNRLGFCESSVIKYITRHRRKDGVEDLQKAIHFIELLIAIEYPEAK